MCERSWTLPGAQTFDWQVYARIIEEIRAQVEVSVYPSYPVIPTTSFQSSLSEDGSRARFAHIKALAARGAMKQASVSSTDQGGGKRR